MVGGNIIRNLNKNAISKSKVYKKMSGIRCACRGRSTVCTHNDPGLPILPLSAGDSHLPGADWIRNSGA